MALKVPRKIRMNKSTYAVRASQAVLQYGVGAMVDFPSQTLMTAAPEYWKTQVTEVHDERLEKALHVDYFGMPGGKDDDSFREGISYVRFPEWYFCPKCRKFQPLKKWEEDFRKKATQKQKDNDPDMVKNIKCSTCKFELVVARIVTVCEHGHIDDFPWVKWVHCKNMNGSVKICPNPSLKFITSPTSSEGLEGLTITCESCKARATLKDAFNQDIFLHEDEKTKNDYNFMCSGRHPWKNEKQACGLYPKAIQRGSSSAYFPVTVSSLVIPPYSSILTTKIEQSKAFSNCKNNLARDKKKCKPKSREDEEKLINEDIEEYLYDIALEIGCADENQIRKILSRKLLQLEEADYDPAGLRYRAEEYDALNGTLSFKTEEYGDFQRESTDVSLYGIPFVKQVSLIHKIREVQALTGFSRLNPFEPSMISSGSLNYVPIKEPETNWYPGYNVYGEGIFIEFDDDSINQWRDGNDRLKIRVETLNSNYADSYIGSQRPRVITGKFLLLHTVAHLLIKQLSFECGYSIASLKERIYCSDDSEGRKMAGILIYTASGDSEGTLGGLVRQGRHDTFPKIFKKAIESAITCSNDPVCSLSSGQGRESLNIAACYSCSLIPETSCEEFNVFLDRGVVVGTFENHQLGFFHEQLYGADKWGYKKKKQKN